MASSEADEHSVSPLVTRGGGGGVQGGGVPLYKRLYVGGNSAAARVSGGR